MVSNSDLAKRSCVGATMTVYNDHMQNLKRKIRGVCVRGYCKFLTLATLHFPLGPHLIDR